MRQGSGRVVFSRMREVIYGRPAASAVAELAEQAAARRVLVIASGTLSRHTDAVAQMCAALGSRFAALFDRVPPHSPRQAVIDAATLAREVRADLIVTIGGGSVTDAGKAVPLCLANDIRDAAALDTLLPMRSADGNVVLPACAPPGIAQIAVPTTLSAGEFSAISGLTDERRSTKELFRHPDLVPAAVVLDPAITLHTPEALFLSTGVRAIDHCVEGLCSDAAHPYSDAQALRGLALLASGLRRVRTAPADLDARLDCLVGAWLSMAPVTTGVPMGASHGIGYVLGAAFGVSHGVTSCILLPAVMRWNRTAIHERQALVAATLGDRNEAADVVLARLIADLGLEHRLADVGIGREQFGRIAELSMATAWVPQNPRRIRGPADVIEILALAA